MVIEPYHPFQRGQLNGFTRLPCTTTMDQFSLVQAVDRLRQRVVVTVFPAANRRFDSSLGQALAMAISDVLRRAVGVVDERYIFAGLVSHHFQRGEYLYEH